VQSPLYQCYKKADVSKTCLSKNIFDNASRKIPENQTEERHTQVPNKCMGLFPYLPTNIMEARSSPPVISRPHQTWIHHISWHDALPLSPIFFESCPFAIKGIYVHLTIDFNTLPPGSDRISAHS
jgi:hypothetical protein